MSGVPIGMMKIIIAVNPRVIHKDRVRAVTVFCGAVLGTTILEIPVGFSTCVWLTATTAFPRLPSTSTTSVFVVYQDSLLRSSRPLSVNSMIFTVFPMVIYSVFKLKLIYRLSKFSVIDSVVELSLFCLLFYEGHGNPVV